MTVIRPFAAIRYATKPGAVDISTRLAPPYDVLDEKDKRALLAPDSKNFVAVDLPHIPPKSAGPPEVYQASQRQIEVWLAEGVLVYDTQPAIYVYHQIYNHGGTRYVRKMFFARLRIEPFGTGSVFPHERTFGGPKEDRLALMKATRAQLSPIFGLYQDPANVVAGKLEAFLTKESLAEGVLDGVENRIWAVRDPAVIETVAKLMADKAIYIADGHHRYGTAGLYRDWLTESAGPLPPDHPANYVLTVFCAMEDPGLLILPTHRVLPGVIVSGADLQSDDNLNVSLLPVSSCEKILPALARFGPQAVAHYDAREKKYRAVTPKNPDILKSLEPDRSEAWRKLGLAFLHAYLLDRLVSPRLCGGKEPEIHYIKSGPPAVKEAEESNGTVFLMQATTMEEMRDVCRTGEVMPQKSTYFYPKLASGLVVNPLEN